MHVRPVPKVSIFMALTTKIVTEKAKKWPKMARFWPKSRYNGRVMAREVFFYQCLWVTKFCAKFGCSRTPRTARAPNSFIVLRCVWKEPAPFQQSLFWVLSATNIACLNRFGSCIKGPTITALIMCIFEDSSKKWHLNLLITAINAPH